jgi:hypothetical protein
MKSSIQLNQPVWVIFIAVALVVAVAGLAVFLLSHTSTTQRQIVQTQMQQQAQAMSAALDRAIGQVKVALQHADLAGNASDLAGLQSVVHQVLNVMEGKQGPDYSTPAGDPGDGHGVEAYLQELLQRARGPIAVAMSVMQMLGLPMATQSQLVQALQGAQTAGQGTIAYLKEALQAPVLSAAQGPLNKAINALAQIQGTPGSMDPATGGLAFAKGVVTQMMNAVLRGGK